MKKVLIGIGAVVIVLAAAVIIIPFLIPAERYKSEITERTRAATGRDLVINGPLSVSVFPSISLTAEDVQFANAPDGRAEHMATLDRLRLSVRFLPLLSGDLQVAGFELVRPEIHLEMDKTGRGNWVMGEAGAAPAAQEESGGGTGFSFLRGLSLENVALTDGQVTYYDARTGETMTFADIDAGLSLPAFDESFTANGDFDWRGETITLDLSLANLQAFLSGTVQDFQTDISSEHITLSVDGTAQMGASPRVTGQTALDIPSIRDLAAWSGNPITMPGSGLGPLSIEGMLDYAGTEIAFTDAAIALDDMQAEGAVTIATDGPRPQIEGRLDVDTLNLNPYLPPAEEGPLVWSEAPIDASGLSAADLDFAFTSKALKVSEVTIGPSRLDLTIENGVLTADLAEMQLYDGAGTGSLRLDGRQDALSLNADFDLKGVAAQPLLTDAAGFERLSGTATTDLAITAVGRSQREIVESLDGKGAFEFLDGEIQGVDLAKVAGTIERVVNGVSEGGGDFLSTLTSGNIMGTLQAVGTMFGAEGAVDESTKFTSLTGSWTAENGVFNNPDLALVGPLVNNRATLRMAGMGQLDLAEQTLNYEARIRSFPEVEQEGGGIGGTVRLTGMMTAPDACVVVGSLCIGSETEPGDVIKQRLFGGDDGQNGESPSPKETIEKGLRGIFGGDEEE